MTDIVDQDSLAYAEQHTTPLDDELAAIARWTGEHTSSPQMMSGLAEARLLQALIVAGGAKRVLEIGTFTALAPLRWPRYCRPAGRLPRSGWTPTPRPPPRPHFKPSPHRDRGR